MIEKKRKVKSKKTKNYYHLIYQLLTCCWLTKFFVFAHLTFLIFSSLLAFYRWRSCSLISSDCLLLNRTFPRYSSRNGNSFLQLRQSSFIIFVKSIHVYFCSPTVTHEVQKSNVQEIFAVKFRLTVQCFYCILISFQANENVSHFNYPARKSCWISSKQKRV